MRVRDSTPADVGDIHEIYAHHVMHGLASFEEIPPDAGEMAQRRESVLALGLPHLVAEIDGRIVGYSYASLYRTRSAYRHTLEDSVYVREGLAGRGIGRALLTELIERFLGLEATTHLSRAALETLAIIAYQQPVTRPQIDSIRGVNSDSMMKSLLSKGLILESGRADGPGRPILYSTTPEFLQHFGLNSILEMPSLAKPEEEGDTHDEMLKG